MGEDNHALLERLAVVDYNNRTFIDVLSVAGSNS